FELARELLSSSYAIFEDLGQSLIWWIPHIDGIVDLLEGDPGAAERRLLAGYEALEAMGDRAYLSTTAAYLAQAIEAQGRGDEALRFSEISEELGDPGDLLTQIIWRSARGKVLAARGRTDEGEALAREAMRISESTDFVNTRADALVDLAQILRGA